MGGRGRQEQEIYEGDIIKDSFDHWKSGKVVEMSFDFIHEFIEYDLDNSEIEIIGNIHEHPELLTYLK
jgi:predicted secreted protein